MSVAAQQDLDIFEAKAQLFHRILDGWHIPFEHRIDQDMALRRCDKKRRKTLRSHVVHIPDDFMRRELLILLVRYSYIPRKQLLDRPDFLGLLRRENRRKGEKNYPRLFHDVSAQRIRFAPRMVNGCES